MPKHRRGTPIQVKARIVFGGFLLFAIILAIYMFA